MGEYVKRICPVKKKFVLVSSNWATHSKHEELAMNMCYDAHQAKFSYPTRSFLLQQRQTTCDPILSCPCTHLRHM